MLTLVCLSVFTNFVVATETQSITVSARDEERLSFYLDDGDEMRYTVYVNGGTNDDIVFDLKNPHGGSIGQKGRIVTSYSDTIYADTAGNYIFEFDNSMSLISKKQVSLDYDIIEKPVFSDTLDYDNSSYSSNSGSGYLLFFILLIIPIIAAVFIIRKSKKAYKEGYEELSNNDKNSETDDSKTIEESFDTQKNSEFIGILKERLAKGEITKEEYLELKKEFE